MHMNSIISNTLDSQWALQRRMIVRACGRRETKTHTFGFQRARLEATPANSVSAGIRHEKGRTLVSPLTTCGA